MKQRNVHFVHVMLWENNMAANMYQTRKVLDYIMICLKYSVTFTAVAGMHCYLYMYVTYSVLPLQLW